MNRSSLDKLISSTGLIMAVVLVATSGALFYAHSFIHKQVTDQLSQQRITFPEAGGKALAALPEADRAKVEPYAGQKLLNGAQAQVFADNYINPHIEKIGGGKTYSELSAASMADPSNTELAGKVQTVFRGETLRGLLLNAYAFDTMGTIAYFGAIGAAIASGTLVVLSGLGFYHAGRITKAAKKRNKA